MNLSPRRLLAAGLGLIVLTNAIALAGVAYNRSGSTASVLRLSGRELAVSRGGGFLGAREDSAMSIRLIWDARTTGSGRTGIRFEGPYSPYYGGRYIPWLDQAKLRALGMDVRLPAGDLDERHTELKHLGRDVYLVLELNGPAYRAAVDEARTAAAAAEKASTEQPDDARARSDARSSGEFANRMAEQATRLFVVDAGLDPDALERQYADPSTYAIVRGHIRPAIAWGLAQPRLTGQISDLRVAEINVPLAFRAALDSLPQLFAPGPSSVSVAVEIRFGRRHEPWIGAVSVPPSPPAAVSR